MLTLFPAGYGARLQLSYTKISGQRDRCAALWVLLHLLPQDYEGQSSKNEDIWTLITRPSSLDTKTDCPRLVLPKGRYSDHDLWGKCRLDLDGTVPDDSTYCCWSWFQQPAATCLIALMLNTTTGFRNLCQVSWRTSETSILRCIVLGSYVGSRPV